MEKNNLPKKSHKEWRKAVKKLRRKRIRQKLAKDRDEKLKEEEIQRQNDPTYQIWLKEQEAFELYQEQIEKLHHDEEEEQWMRRELIAQKKFLEEKKKREQSEKEKEEARLAIKREFEKQREILKQRAEKKKREVEENLRKHKILMEKIKEYIEKGGKIPDELLEKAETNPGKELCVFFCKTGSCRFGDKCTRNHSRPGINKILLLPHFFNHIRLEQNKVTEYGNDLVLEFSDEELYKDYQTFFEDVISELEKFGRIENFRTSQNHAPHLCGNVYVEYQKERDALKAFMNLQGRYYASKRINVEFSAITSWKSALCGLSLTKTCPKGRNCNFIHIFKNPKNKYNVPLKDRDRSERRQTSVENSKRSSNLSWNDDDDVGRNSKKHWRWSESPPPERNCNRRKENRDSSQSSHRKENRDRSQSSHKTENRNRSQSSHRTENPNRSRSNRRKRSHSSSSYSRSRSRSIDSDKRKNNRVKDKSKHKSRKRKHKKYKSSKDKYESKKLNKKNK